MLSVLLSWSLMCKLNFMHHFAELKHTIRFLVKLSNYHFLARDPIPKQREDILERC